VNSFWQMPERLYDDPDELADWTRQAVAVAHRAQLKKTKRSRKPTKTAPQNAVAKKPVKKRKTAAKPKRAVKRRA
jgi:DNA transformation protein